MINRKLKRNSGEFFTKVIIGTSLGLVLIMAILFTHNIKKINNLEKELYLKKQVEDRATDYSISTLNVKTIQENLNELKSYSVLKGSKVNMSHTYIYEQDAFLGLKRRAEIKGSANLIYNCDISFADAVITQDKKGNITVQISEPYVDVDSIHYEPNTLLLEEEKYNVLCNEDDGQRVMKYYLESLVENGKDKIQSMYNDNGTKLDLNRRAILEVQELIKGFNLNNCSVQVKIK